MTVPNQAFQDDSLQAKESNFIPDLPTRYKIDGIFKFAAWAAVIFALAILAILLIDVAIDGLPKINWQFLTSFPSRRPSQAGIL
ncbi:MAG: hypothetical protein NW224_29470, partial [Leptolyngbyaceae cyanobacterium bins.302]|nr:hypothetical protein [Leptolyngbyaceae cyanobacterium bins.302]